MSNLIHIHTHFDSSVLDGMSSIKKAIKRAKELDMSALAMTDHGSMQGTYRFYKECVKEGIKPIIGCEFYIGDKGSKDTYHIIVIAKNNVGFKNLCHLMTHGAMENFYSKPRISKEMLFKHKEGLIVTTACIGGELYHLYKTSTSYMSDFLVLMTMEFPYDFYIEIQPNSLPEQREFNLALERLGLTNLVVGCDMHYVLKEDYDTHDTLLAMQVQKKKDDTKRFRFTTNDFYMMSEDEVKERLDYLRPQTIETAINNTSVIASKCNLEIKSNLNLLPNIGVEDDKKELARLMQLGFVERYNEGAFNGLDIEMVKHRLQYEYKIICDKGYASYFLIVQDFIKFCEAKDIPYGGGRGSVAGCEIAYVLGFTELEPIKYGLLFERFLNPTRNSPPD